MKIFTIGHSNRSIEQFLELLAENGIQRIVDCRTSPRSRWPHFNSAALRDHLQGAGIKYDPRGNNLGGLGRNVMYDETVEELSRAAEHENIALMCSEGKPSDCHRTSMLRPSFEACGLEVVDILWVKQSGAKLPTAQASLFG